MTDNSKALVPANTPEQAKTSNTITTSIEVPKRIGLLIFLLVFGVFGIWASVAPLDGSAHAVGKITVKSYKKIVQHLEGGIVSEILVRDGDKVNVGDPLLILDDTQSMAQLGMARSQSIALQVREARLIAERDGLDRVIYPESLSTTDNRVADEIAAQNSIFAAKKSSFENNVEILEQRIDQLESQVVGLKALKASKEELAASFAEELADTQSLLDRGFSDKNTLRTIERNHASYRGEAADLSATIAATEVRIGETRLQILQLERDSRNEVVNELSQVQTELKDVSERIIALEDIVSRTVVRAPDTGIVNGMQVHTIGQVLNPYSAIAEIVPASDELIVEARVSSVDIDRVSVGQEADIRFSAFNRSVPTIEGEVISLSADSLIEETTGASFYMARLEVTPAGLEELGDLVLMPGMPAEVFINTGSRTFFQYLFKPLSDGLARSFNED